MLGDSSEDRMAKSGAKWLNQQGIHVMAMSPDKKDYSHHNYPLERFGMAIAFMKAQGCEKLGVVGASTTGLLVSFMFKAGKDHPKECRETRVDIDRRLKKALAEW